MDPDIQHLCETCEPVNRWFFGVSRRKYTHLALYTCRVKSYPNHIVDPATERHIVTVWLDPPRVTGTFRAGEFHREGSFVSFGWASPEAARSGDNPTTITLHNPGGIAATDMSRFAWTRWLTKAALEIKLRDGFTVQLASRLRRATSEAARTPHSGRPYRPGRKGHPVDHYPDIAARYLELVDNGSRNPTHTIASENYVTRNTAAGWIRKCRQLGLIPPGRPGKAG